jgi:TPR repeat protein
MYFEGQGLEKSYEEAARWYRKAAEQGDTVSQFIVGFTFEKGLGVTQDYVQAHMWLNIAAAHATGNDQQKYGAERDELARLMTPEQIAEAQRLAREWKVISASQR